ncbi:hypothetical protein [Pseudoalteromonas aurantia]|uniref:Bacteriocin n=1 Tax=Pseudoalteromonas aurantia 208 TaxID=1314867 RepID=A0ABR9EEP9_9GAMM|nr:hypothetical protein [Pseudoalteromonas aurantia]MBE0369242.1 hypothetical protein [Pseudoalteromonas aurantia 208]
MNVLEKNELLKVVGGIGGGGDGVEPPKARASYPAITAKKMP